MQKRYIINCKVSYHSLAWPTLYFKSLPNKIYKSFVKCASGLLFIKFSSMSIGLDYEKKIVKLSPEIPSIIDNEFVNRFLQHYISNIVPINPSNVKFNIRKHKKSQLTIFNFKRLKVLIVIIALLNIFVSLNIMNYSKYNFKYFSLN